MRVLVTGGAGFIGSHVVDAYVAAGHEVSVLDNLSTGKLANLNPAATLYQADIRDPEGVARAFGAAQPEVVCHQAALADVRASMREPTLYAEVNIIGSINLLEAARRQGVKKFIYASTGGAAYGEPEFLPAWPDGVAQTSLVIFLDRMKPDFVTSLFASATNQPTIDRADQQALA